MRTHSYLATKTDTTASAMTLSWMPESARNIGSYSERTRDIGRFRVISTQGSRSPLTLLLGRYGFLPEEVVSRECEAALGENGLQRLRHFRLLPTGWDGRDAMPLDILSLRSLSSFFSASRISPDGLGLFLTPSGNLSVNWEDERGFLTEIEFAREGFILYLEAFDTEATFPIDLFGASTLLSLLKDSHAI